VLFYFYEDSSTYNYAVCSELLSPREIPNLRITSSSLFISDATIQFEITRLSTCNYSAKVFVVIMDMSTMGISNNISLNYTETFSQSSEGIINTLNSTSIVRLTAMRLILSQVCTISKRVLVVRKKP